MPCDLIYLNILVYLNIIAYFKHMHDQLFSYLFSVLIDVIKRFCVIDSKHTQETLSSPHVLVPHCTGGDNIIFIHCARKTLCVFPKQLFSVPWLEIIIFWEKIQSFSDTVLLEYNFFYIADQRSVISVTFGGKYMGEYNS